MKITKKQLTQIIKEEIGALQEPAGSIEENSASIPGIPDEVKEFFDNVIAMGKRSDEEPEMGQRAGQLLDILDKYVREESFDYVEIRSLYQ